MANSESINGNTDMIDNEILVRHCTKSLLKPLIPLAVKETQRELHL